MPRFFVLLFLALGLVCGVAAGCSPTGDPPRNGVNDVRKACELRAAWTMPTAQKCINCVAAAPQPKCACEEFKEFAGLCQSQQDARRADPGCTVALDDCLNLCVKDCSCLEACYGQATNCKQLDGARDGCVADVCAPYCN